jgi:O-acetylhomoserine/O-acetylserine sulfhydrylase-like pyridoxal-dependent enzyme
MKETILRMATVLNTSRRVESLKYSLTGQREYAAVNQKVFDRKMSAMHTMHIAVSYQPSKDTNVLHEYAPKTYI